VLPAPVVIAHADDKPTRFGELFEGIYTRRTILIWLAFFTTYFVNTSTTVWLPPLYVKLGGLPPKDALLLSLTSGVIGLITIVVFGWYSDRIGRVRGFMWGYGISIVGFVAAFLALAVFKVDAWPVLFLIGVVGMGGVQLNAASCYLYPPELFPTRMRAWATSTGGAMNRIASFIAPTVIGGLLGAGFGLISVVVLLCAMCLIGLIVIATLGIETRGRTLEQISS
jgi:putative MFS transporter